jgi:protein TonB
MFYSRIDSMLVAFDARWPSARRRAVGITLALLIEAGLFLAILTLGGTGKQDPKPGESLTTVDFAPAPKPDEPQPKPDDTAQPRALPPVRPPPTAPQPPIDVPPMPAPPAPAIPLAKSPAPAAPSNRARAVIRDDMSGPIGPPDTGYPGDSERVAGSGPNGQPLYAARWHREPYPEELRGYLSTANGPGWALINCQTQPGFRVDNCVLTDEYPDGSGMGRAVLAAAWQFKVRPPQVGGRALVGEWVRIRITYEMIRK